MGGQWCWARQHFAAGLRFLLGAYCSVSPIALSLTRKLYQLAVLVHFDYSNALVPLRQQSFDVQAGVAVSKQAQIVLNKMVDGTAIALEYDHTTVVCLFADGLCVACVAQLAQVDYLHAALHPAKSL